MSSANTSSGRKAIFDELKSTIPAAAMETIPADPQGKKIPESILQPLKTANSLALLSVPKSQYNCMTEQQLPPPIAASSRPLDLWIGMGNNIPRWEKGKVINFATLATGYPTKQHATFAAYKLSEAAAQWNALNVGVTFKWVDKVEDAAFVLAYGGDQGSVLASAFFPDAKELNTLFVYQAAFEPAASMYQSNIFLHELGHVLGLRHEFASQEGFGAVKFGPANPRSVMSYVFPPNIRDSDETYTKKFYDYTPSTFEGITIVDHVPDN